MRTLPLEEKKKEEGFKELQVHTEPQTTNLSHLNFFFFSLLYKARS